jgi:hypothetical protein
MKVGDKVTVEAVVTMVGEELVAVAIRGLQGVEHIRLRRDEVHTAKKPK